MAAPPGFLDAHGDVLQIATAPRTNDPLHALPAERLVVHVDQAYGNCPQHIHPHDLAYGTGATVQMSGTAHVPWSPQRRVEFVVRHVVDGLSAHQPA
ncbi:hypothetical protein BVC93_14570 [Mycobacterium sp. MS1601]|uniref:hypothetical protein n=1 Tax=Mycobacterium sp. MS1601 TaxID=1936029 RepID=UPI00097926E0|nr:hypothetical protein [Mycobacterium sp. MS1601]AQA03428.1 hypothetical protein BVC93_14570 [Mycobacterium sp. MS1601]